MNKLHYFLLFFYIFYYIWLSINPFKRKFIKSTYFKYLPKEVVLDYYVVRTQADLNQIRGKYPLIFKPTVCNTLGVNVVKIKNEDEAKIYLEGKDERIVVQEFHPGPYEAVILYERLPISKRGKVISVVLRNTNELKFRPLSCSNTECINRSDLISPELTTIFDNLTQKVPDLYVCRYDIRFSSIEAFKQGHFKILEMNGTMGYDNATFNHPSQLEINDENDLLSIGSLLLGNIRWFLARLLIGLINLLTFNTYDPIYPIFHFFHKTLLAIKCLNWGHVFCEALTC